MFLCFTHASPESLPPRKKAKRSIQQPKKKHRIHGCLVSVDLPTWKPIQNQPFMYIGKFTVSASYGSVMGTKKIAPNHVFPWRHRWSPVFRSLGYWDFDSWRLPWMVLRSFSCSLDHFKGRTCWSQDLGFGVWRGGTKMDENGGKTRGWWWVVFCMVFFSLNHLKQEWIISPKNGMQERRKEHLLKKWYKCEVEKIKL